MYTGERSFRRALSENSVLRVESREFRVELWIGVRVEERSSERRGPAVGETATAGPGFSLLRSSTLTPIRGAFLKSGLRV